jgi:hypothetical protein
MVTLYQSLVANADAKMKRQSVTTGFLMGYSQFSIYAVYGLIIWFGGLDIYQGRTSFDSMLKVGLMSGPCVGVHVFGSPPPSLYLCCSTTCPASPP